MSSLQVKRPRWPRLVVAAVVALAVSAVLVVLYPPLALFHPRALDPERPLRVTGSAPLAAEVEIIYDEHGVPHVFGDSEGDLAYGLGFVHARDRLFQIELLRHAASGRLAELFGEALLPADRRLRLVSYGVAEQLAAMGARDRALLAAYAAGVNAGAREVGASLEMRLLGVVFAPFTELDALAVARLQAWELALDYAEELARSRIAARLDAADPRRVALMQPQSSGGVPIVRLEEHGGALPVNDPAPAPPTRKPSTIPEPPDADEGAVEHGSRTPELPVQARRLLAWLGMEHTGASNSWAVHGGHTKSGHAILCNDPHLRHGAPGVFYLVHLEHPDFTLVGATMPGLPAVLIGHTRRMAWGLTASYADAQDLYRVALAPGDGSSYMVDGVPVAFRRWQETYRVGRGERASSFTEEWRSTLFGPVLPPAYAERQEPGQLLALMWSGFVAGDLNRHVISGFWDLARVDSPDELDAVVEHLSFTGQNMVFAFVDGSIAYRLAAALPVRPTAEGTHLPRSGRAANAMWRGFVPMVQKPSLTNPKRGYIVTANQRVTEDGTPWVSTLGGNSAQAHRARRITERLDELLARGKPNAEELLAIQQDVVSVEARDLAPALAPHCPATIGGHPAELAEAFCAAVARFDGAYTVDSMGALAFSELLAALRVEVLIAAIGEPLAHDHAQRQFVRDAVERAVLAEATGERSPLFDDPRTAEHEGLAPFVARAARRALDHLVASFGAEAQSWRWGAVHRLSFASPLAKAPLIGRWFASPAFEEAGHGSTPRAESGVPVATGSALRMVAEMSDPPRVRMVIDTGNSGHVGHEHALDQYPRWRDGEPLHIPMARAEVERVASGRIILVAP